MFEPSPRPGHNQAEADGQAHEARRQQALMQAILAAPSASDNPGLRAHRGHLRVLSGQLLTEAYPCLALMVGAETLAQLGWRLWQQSPPTSGDLGEWGLGLPGLLDAMVAHDPDWQAWACLPDLARVEWACHLCERAEDTVPELSSLALLEQAQPEHLCIDLRPGVQCIASSWPVVSLWQALQSEGGDLQSCLNQPLPETAIVSRGGPHAHMSPWKAQVHALAPGHLSWMRQLTHAQPPSLAQMLDTREPGFDFTAWLTQALHQGWIWRFRNRAGEN